MKKTEKTKMKNEKEREKMSMSYTRKRPYMRKENRDQLEQEGYAYIMSRCMREWTPEHNEIIEGWMPVKVGDYYGYQTPEFWPYRCVFVPFADDEPDICCWDIFEVKAEPESKRPEGGPPSWLTEEIERRNRSWQI